MNPEEEATPDTPNGDPTPEQPDQPSGVRRLDAADSHDAPSAIEDSSQSESDEPTLNPDSAIRNPDSPHAPQRVTVLEFAFPAKAAPEAEEHETLELATVADAKAALEGFLFSTNEPLSVQRLSKLLNNLHPRTVQGLLLELQMDYDDRPGALQIVEVAGGYQMSTRPSLALWMYRLHKHKRRSPLSPATLETLAIIAYRQPLTKGDIETIRGVESGATLRTLQDLGLVETAGRREVAGRPQLYATTEQFLRTFGLRSLADLPSISELKSKFAEDVKLKAAVAATTKPANPEPLADPALGLLDEQGNPLQAKAEVSESVAAEPDLSEHDTQELHDLHEHEDIDEPDESDAPEDTDLEDLDELDEMDLEDLEEEDGDEEEPEEELSPDS